MNEKLSPLRVCVLGGRIQWHKMASCKLVIVNSSVSAVLNYVISSHVISTWVLVSIDSVCQC